MYINPNINVQIVPKISNDPKIWEKIETKEDPLKRKKIWTIRY